MGFFEAYEYTILFLFFITFFAILCVHLFVTEALNEITVFIMSTSLQIMLILCIYYLEMIEYDKIAFIFHIFCFYV